MQKSFLLSSAGSTRATSYQFGNKVIRIGDKTHVVWLDAVDLVKGRTYNHALQEWGEVYDICVGYDNHTNPAITADADGYIHLAWGPHGDADWNKGRFKWLKSAKPNDISSWTDEQNFGYSATYACLTQTQSGHDVIVYRGGEEPYSSLFQRSRSTGGWTTAKAVFHQDVAPQYVNMGSYIVCDRNNTLYTASHFYNVGREGNAPVGGDTSLMGSLGTAALKSSDLGKTWTDLKGRQVVVPALYSEDIAIPTSGTDARMCGLVVDSKNQLWALTCNARLDTRELLLSCWKDGAWETV
ncbi:MAG: BNR-4 repeat-containing protein, partial [Planctomycetota bacterium]